MNLRKHCIVGLIACLSFGLQAAPDYVSPEQVAAAPDGKTVYVSAGTSDKLFVVDAAGGTLLREITLKAPASGLTVAADGTIYAVGGAEAGLIWRIDPATGKILRKAETGHTPMAPVASSDGATLYICNRFANQVEVFSTERLKKLATIPVPREPVAAALGADGKLLFVANHLPADAATNDWVSALISVIDTATHQVVATVRLPNGSTGVRGLAASPDGAFIYVTHTFGRYQLPTTQLERGWMNTAGLSVLDGATGAYVNTVLLDDVDLGAANPWGVSCSPDGKMLLVAHAGTRELSLIDRPALHERLARVARNEKVTEVSKTAADVPNDLSFLVSLRRRVRLGGDGPRGIAVADGKAVVALYFAEAVALLPLADASAAPALLQLAPAPDLSKDRIRRGEMLFNDAAMCFQMWQSCASCHPDGRADALNWDLLNDGIGNPKQSKNMLLCDKTPPTMVSGIRKDMQTCNRKGMTHIQFVMRPEEDALCVDAYVIAMRPVKSPFAESDDLRKGRKLFTRAGCIECHPADNGLFTNLQKYDLGLGIGNEEGTAFDTPTLVEVWRTAPYLYDGRARTMEEVLTICNPQDTHGKTSNLSPAEIKALATYVLSL